MAQLQEHTVSKVSAILTMYKTVPSSRLTYLLNRKKLLRTERDRNMDAAFVGRHQPFGPDSVLMDRFDWYRPTQIVTFVTPVPDDRW